VFRTTRGRRLPALADALWGALAGVGILILSLLLWYPYSISYRLQQQGLGRTTMKSDLPEFLGVWALLLVAGYVGFLASPDPERDESSRRRGDFLMAIFAAACLLVAFAVKGPALVAILPLGLLGLRLGLRAVKSAEGNSEDLFTAFLIVLAVAMIAGCEFIYFKDSYGQALQRMNTIFKFYHQAWPILAIGVAVLAERAWSAAPGSAAVRMTLTAAMAISLFYPLEAASSRFRQREGKFSLDLRAGLARRNSGDAAAIEWLNGNAPPRSVLLEATGDPYSEFARISSHTGIPTVLGWANHEGLWRSNDPEIATRSAAVRAFFTATNPNTAGSVLRRYRVTHVVIGDMERRTYPAASEVGALPFLQLVFPGETTIYKVSASPAP
jgi:YYY domain-containing protein